MEAHSCLHLLHLTCVFLVFLKVCYNGSSLMQVRPMYDGRPFASLLFRRLAGRGAFFSAVSLFGISLTRCLTVYDAVSCSMEDPLYECGRPHDTMSSLFSTALWLQRSQSILVQEIQPAKDINLTCYKTLPTKAITGLPMEFIFLEWPVALPPECEQSYPSSFHEIPMTIIFKTPFQLTRTPVGDVMLFNHLRYSMILQVGIHVATSPTEVCDVLFGTPGISLDRFFFEEKQGAQAQIFREAHLTTTTSVPRRCTGRMSFSKLFRCGPRDSSFLVFSSLVTRMQEDRPFASTRTFCLRMLL